MLWQGEGGGVERDTVAISWGTLICSKGQNITNEILFFHSCSLVVLALARTLYYPKPSIDCYGIKIGN